MAIPILILASFFLVWLIIAIVAPWKFANGKKGALMLALRSRQNCYLEYRVRDQDQDVTEWKSAPLIRQRNRNDITSYFPEKRERKTFNTSERVMRLLKQYGYSKSAHIDPYWYVINYLKQADDAATAQALQFRIVARKNYGQQNNGGLLFISDWHVQ
jgi:hypothetical protein